MSAGRRYGDVLRTPHVRRLLGTALIARATIGVDGLAIVLFLRQISGSYAVAGAAAAAFAAAAALGGPLISRLVDRRGAWPLLLQLACIHAVALLAIVALGRAGSTAGAVIASFAAGACVPPVGAVMRALWSEVLHDRPDLVTVAYALDSALVEVAFVAGPLLVAGAYAASGPEYALILSAVLVVVGTLLFSQIALVLDYHPTRGEDRVQGLFGVLRSPGMRTLVATTLPIGFCLGACEVTFPAFGESVGNRGYAGLLIAVWSAGSGIGGLLYGARPHRRELRAVFVRIVCVFPLATLPLAAPSSLLAMLPLALIAGAAIAPTVAAANQLVGDVAPAGALTEAFTWPLTTLVAGVAGGNAVAGAVIQAAGWRVSFLVAAAVGSLATVVAVSRRETLGRAHAA